MNYIQKFAKQKRKIYLDSGLWILDSIPYSKATNRAQRLFSLALKQIPAHQKLQIESSFEYTSLLWQLNLRNIRGLLCPLK
jgi:hypothetical protein